MSSWKTISRASLLAALLGGTAAAQNPIEVERLEALDPLEVSLTAGGLGDRAATAAAKAIAQTALERGSMDNITVVVMTLLR